MKKVFLLLGTAILFIACEKNYHSELELTSLHVKAVDILSGNPATGVNLLVYGKSHEPSHQIGTRGSTNEYGVYNGSFKSYESKFYDLQIESSNHVPNVENYRLTNGEFNEIEISVYSLGRVNFSEADSNDSELKNIQLTTNEDFLGAPYTMNKYTSNYFQYELAPEGTTVHKASGTWTLTYEFRKPGTMWSSFDTIIEIPRNDTLHYTINH